MQRNEKACLIHCGIDTPVATATARGVPCMHHLLQFKHNQHVRVTIRFLLSPSNTINMSQNVSKHNPSQDVSEHNPSIHHTSLKAPKIQHARLQSWSNRMGDPAQHQGSASSPGCILSLLCHIQSWLCPWSRPTVPTRLVPMCVSICTFACVILDIALNHEVCPGVPKPPAPPHT